MIDNTQKSFYDRYMNDIVKQLKIPFLTVLLTLTLLYLFTALLGPIPFSVKSTTTTSSDLFTVSGIGEETAVPDTATFTVGVTKTAPSAEAAKELVNTSTNQIIAQLKKLGIDEKDIKTQNFSSYPNYDASPARPLSMSTNSTTGTTTMMAMPESAPGEQNISGYTVSQDLTVTTKSVDTANKALDASVASGANQIAGVSFTINDEDRKKLEQNARKKAIADAKQKAQDIAGDAGIKLGKIVNIFVSDNNNMPVMMYDRKMEAGTMDAAAPTNLQPGENTVRVDVTLSYETL